MANKWHAKKTRSAPEDVLLHPKPDRRHLAYVPDPDAIRMKMDRRGDASSATEQKLNQRYEAAFPVRVRIDGRFSEYRATCKDISGSGILLKFKSESDALRVYRSKNARLRFRIPPGALAEGMEAKYKLPARAARIVENDPQSCAMRFHEPLQSYLGKRRDRYALTMAALMMFFVALIIMFMRTESILYFEFNKTLYAYSIVTAIFLLSRYLFGALYKPFPLNPDFTPGVTIIIPCFNEEKWIHKTIACCINQDYPVDKLEVIVVDDCSSDRSVRAICRTIASMYNEDDRFRVKERLRLIARKKNGGKREALAMGALASRHEMIVFVDSDSFLEPDAIRNLVQPFQDERIAGVSGRTDVANTYTNNLTKLQTVRYYVAFRIMKAAEAYFDAVTCLSGPLSCYRKSIVLENLDSWRNQRFLGQKATFGDDRSLTNFLLRNHRTFYQDTALCSTIVPNQHKMFLKQQMRWKRSWLRESMIAGTFIWKKEPFMALFFYMGLITPVLAPIIVIYNLIYVPVTRQLFPGTFLLGLLLMSLMMSFAQLFFKKSSIWLYGFWFCVYYEFVLLWQMPVAWFTFWKSTWGTRQTPEDEKAARKKQSHKKQTRKPPSARQNPKYAAASKASQPPV